VAGLFRSQLGVQFREPVGVLIGRQRPPIARPLPQGVQAGAGEAREGEAARRIDDFDQTAFQQRADRGPIQRGLAFVGAGGPAVQPDTVVERIGLPAACPELCADQAALGGGERCRVRVFRVGGREHGGALSGNRSRYFERPARENHGFLGIGRPVSMRAARRGRVPARANGARKIVFSGAAKAA